MTQEIENKDPQMVFDQGSSRILSNVHNGLLIQGLNNSILPGVAKSWYLEDDNLTWVFNLRKGAKFHNGKEVTPGPYHPEKFFAMAKGMENLPEGGERCFSCYRLRLEQAAQAAKAGGYDYFATTLSISPHKNAQKLNEIGFALAEKYGVAWLPSDFKKRGGYQRSIVLSHEYHLYRQNYCGCVYSAAEAARRREEQP